MTTNTPTPPTAAELAELIMALECAHIEVVYADSDTISMVETVRIVAALRELQERRSTDGCCIDDVAHTNLELDDLWLKCHRHDRSEMFASELLFVDDGTEYGYVWIGEIVNAAPTLIRTIREQAAEIERLKGEVPRCVCGIPTILGVVHCTDVRCYWAPPSEIR